MFLGPPRYPQLPPTPLSDPRATPSSSSGCSRPPRPTPDERVLLEGDFCWSRALRPGDHTCYTSEHVCLYDVELLNPVCVCLSLSRSLSRSLSPSLPLSLRTHIIVCYVHYDMYTHAHLNLHNGRQVLCLSPGVSSSTPLHTNLALYPPYDLSGCSITHTPM